MTDTIETTTGWLAMGRAYAPPRLAREDVESLRQLSNIARSKKWWNDGETMKLKLHADRDDDRKLALAKLGREAPHVLVRVDIFEERRDLLVYAVVGNGSWQVTSHRFQLRAKTKEWVRILSRSCRYAFGMIVFLRTSDKAQARVAARARHDDPCVESS